MKLKLKYNSPGIEISLPSKGESFPTAFLAEMPRFYCKHYGLWKYFDFESEAERKKIEEMTLEEARQADLKDNEEKEKALFKTNNKEVIKDANDKK